ncbi:arginine decarboxylase-like [Andrographis paniculata]|uniref:arginine decarboxylase-like n=1 Tax=Andrographis paniculata TaxID=175694 RepID=UPI0021E7C603|nr:arginine decarboxylase-like [Andrographis paniculata]
MPVVATRVETAADPQALANGGAGWSPADSAALYKIDGWGAPYFSVNSNGNVAVRPHGVDTKPHQEIDLLKVVKKAAGPKTSGGLGLRLPVLVRFPDVLKNRLTSLQSSFDLEIESQGYAGRYQGVYPVKCNQDKYVVQDIVRFGSGFRFGLEAGSKPELLLAMTALCHGSSDALLVCNGFKDAEYIFLALTAAGTLKLNAVIVLEQEDELDVVIRLSNKLRVRPVIGVRAKLRTKHSGHFGSTSGENGKFGLTAAQILRVVKKLGQNQMLDCLQLLHFHIGSQIPTTALLADGVAEAAQIYCELVRLGASMAVLDVGGGLGIDYDGSNSANSDVSVSYTLQEYAAAVVRSVQTVCNRRGVKHPVLCSESGRAIVSHHSILVFEAFSSTPTHDPPPIELKNIADQFFGDDAVADFNTERLKENCIEQFRQGTLPLEHLAAVDGLCESAAAGDANTCHITTYNVNLSIFSSIPDFWGIGQLFPMVPIHRLDERPTRRGILSDLTCDSDGKIDKFIGKGENRDSLPLHNLESNCNYYYIGMFVGGAYQEALGGFHNLFGRASVVRVSQSDGPHGFAVTHVAPGASCGEVLRLMRHEPEEMFETLRERMNMNMKDNKEKDVVDGIARSFNNMPYLGTWDWDWDLNEEEEEEEEIEDWDEEEWAYC